MRLLQIVLDGEGITERTDREMGGGHEEHLGGNILYLCSIESGHVKTRKSARSTGKAFYGS